MYRLSGIITCLLFFSTAHSQFPTPDWVVAGAGDRTIALDLDTDAQDNIYMLAGYQDNSSFMGIPWTTPGIYGTAVSKLGPGGSLHWSETFSGSLLFTARNIAVSGGHLMISGPLSGTLYYPGGSTFALTGEDYVFICMDTSGQFQWIRQGQYITGSKVLADGSGGFYMGIAGGFPSQNPVLEGDTLAQGNYIARIDAQGNTIWENNYPNDFQYGFADFNLNLSDQGTLSLCTTFRDTLVIDGDTAYSHGNWVQDMANPDSTYYWDSDLLIVELDTSGNPVWKGVINGNGEPHDLKFDEYAGQYYITYYVNLATAGDTLVYLGDSIMVPTPTRVQRTFSLEPNVGLDWVYDQFGNKRARDFFIADGTGYLCGEDSFRVWLHSFDLSPSAWQENASPAGTIYFTFAFTMKMQSDGDLLVGGTHRNELALGNVTLEDSSMIGTLFLAKFANVWLDSPEQLPESEIDLAIFPNPASQLLHLQSEAQGIAGVELFSLQGQLLLRRENSGRSPELDVSGLPRGTYLMRVQFREGQSVTRRVILQ